MPTPAELMDAGLYRLPGVDVTMYDDIVASDEAEQIIGGVVYRLEGDGVVVLDGIVVNQILAERGISGAIMNDFCTRMKSMGCQVIKTHFFLRRFYQRHGFKMDQRRGGLVRFL